jgi:two-component system, sensor histidine kinase and response regulator
MTRILVIEDETLLRENIVELLSMEGFEAIGAEDGQSGIALAQSSLPDLIVCDVMMPGIDGYEVLAVLRNEPTTALIPFIFLTAKGTPADFRTGMNSGADDYLVKPFKQIELLDAIASRLSRQTAVSQLQQKIEELEKFNLLKDEFLETITDELREPMTNIMMAIRMIRNAPSKEKQQRYINVLQIECSRELDLIKNLLELQKLETNTRPIRLESLNLQEWIPIIVEPVRHRTRERQQIMQVNIPPYLPSILIDTSDLKQILEELLTNACKCTPAKGRILLEIYRTPGKTDHTSTSITTFIVNNEAEIPADAIPKIFDQFYRIPSSDRWQQGGSGLGLTLVKKLVERLNGTIQVNSEAGWTQVSVQLPTMTS